MKCEEYVDFFHELSRYYKNENDLSNICVALCNSNKCFRELFLRFFFDKINLEEVGEIKREICDPNGMNSRVDIHISTRNGKIYIIEVKIGDRNHHFKQYEEAFGVDKNHFGYITNYPCNEGWSLGYHVRTWSEFYDYLNKLFSDNVVVSGFLRYLGNLCNIIRYTTPMKLTNLNSIPQFIRTVDGLCTSLSKQEGIESSHYKDYAYVGDVHTCYRIDMKGTIFFICYGLWFQQEPVVTIAINGNPELTSGLLNLGESIFKDAEFCTEPYSEFVHSWGDNVWIDLKKDKTIQFLNSEDYAEQKKILALFLQEIIEGIQKVLSQN